MIPEISSKVQSIKLPYHKDGRCYFDKVAGLRWPLWLDSNQGGRYDIICANPTLEITASTEVTTVQYGPDESERFESIWSAAKAILPFADNPSPWPFIGGLAGYWGYDANHKTIRINSNHQRSPEEPVSQLGFYPWCLIIDHDARECHLVSGFEVNLSAIEKILTEGNESSSKRDWSCGPISPLSDRETYCSNVNSIKEGILRGDYYQVNYAQCFECGFSGDPRELYLSLRNSVVAPYSGYMATDERTILSLSPERFVEVDDHTVTTEPIKGTAPRHIEPQTDFELSQQLLASNKDRAENLMIVDLMRNDLSKSCELGSVKTTDLFALKSFSQVHHLVSTIRGQLSDSKTPLDLLEDCFPGGSITGAPKRSAMQCIEDIEEAPRQAYCGSLGYISSHGRMDTNIAIRTAIIQNNTLRCWGGGGITIDSDADKEFQETLDKVGAILKILNP